MFAHTRPEFDLIDEANPATGGLRLSYLGLTEPASDKFNACPYSDVYSGPSPRVLRINLIGTWLGIRAAVPALRAAGGGSIVNISSLAGMRGYEGLSTYGMSKWAVRGLTHTAARELGPDRIRVNSVHPGTIENTGMFTTPTDPEAYDRLYKVMPLRRPGTSAEVSGVVIHLLSDQSSFVSGTEHVVDGGSWA